MNELESLIILSSLPSIGSVKIRQLLQHYSTATAVLQAPLEEIATFPGFTPRVMQAWKKGIDSEAWKSNLTLAERLQADILLYTSPDYPKSLLEIHDFPLILYAKGKIIKNDVKSLAVIGTRQTSIYGIEMAKELSFQLAQAGYTIVSGLARGIDTAAHQGALAGGRTIAVLGSGLAHIYPSENRSLAQAISNNGALLSEFPMSTPPDRPNFPRRNRIVSGMTLGTVLIEAPIKSGAMLTAELAFNQKRPLFALPGRADQESFKGNHSLIKQKKAQLIENVQDILDYFQEEAPLTPRHPPGDMMIPLDREEEELLKQLPPQEATVEEIMLHTPWPVAKLNSLLMSLVLKKRIKEYPGKFYKKVNKP